MSLRDTIFRGGIYLMARQLAGMIIGLGGMLVLTRTIGPGAFGVYTAAAVTYAYLTLVSQWGIGIYLIRKTEEIEPDEYHQAFTLLLLLGVGGLMASILAVPLIQHWLRFDGFEAVALAVFAVLPLQAVALVPWAILERALDYRRVAGLELVGQLGFYAMALPLAVMADAGVWAPVAGWWVQQLLMALLAFWFGGYRPRLRWNRDRVRALLGYGLSYQASVLVWQVRFLVNPLVVGGFAGAEAVGIVALAIRIAEALSFVKTVTWRLSVAAMARMGEDRPRLARAVTEGMRLQVMALAPAMVAFSLIAPWIVPRLFGPQWQPVVLVFPFVALGNLANGAFNLHYSALYALRLNWEVAAFRATHVVLFLGSSLILVPALGVVGYGWAEVVALGGYWMAHHLAVTRVGPIGTRVALAWAGAASLALFWPWLGAGAAVGLIAVMVWPETWRVLGGYWMSVRRLRQA